MSKNKATYVTLFCLIILAYIYFNSARTLGNNGSDNTLGPGYLPIILAVLLTILCLVSFFQTLKKKDEKISIPNLKFVILTIILMALFFITWGFWDHFYINVFVFIAVLLTVYKDRRITIKNIIYDCVVSISSTLAIYLLFTLILNINF